MKELTTKQKLFVEAYLQSPNGAQAAKVAGYKGDDKQLAVIASQNLSKLNIRERVEERITQAAMSADEVLSELAEIAKGNYSTYRGDKLKALELVGKHHKLFTDKIEASGKDGSPLIEVVFTQE